jgi:glycyl-tRNA synthetase beta chain
MSTLLIEIGTEEIPAGYIEPALEAMGANLAKKLTNARIDHGQARLLGTPRRLTVILHDLASKQKSISTEMIGPPAKIGFDQDGNPTVAAEKFAEKVGLPLTKIKIKQTSKGDYLCAKKSERGLATGTLLKTILPEVILATPFPKSMRWADLDVNFARPIHYIVALLGDRVISFKVGDVKSGRYTVGHSFMQPTKIKLAHTDHYFDMLRDAHVIVDIDERKKLVEAEVNRCAHKVGGQVLPDAELLDTVTNLVEQPVAVVGRFEDKFLELPDEVLITSMREHQKYFAVTDGSGKLKPCFVAVNNTTARDMDLVAQGHERVIRARLEDGLFFYRLDLEHSLEDNAQKLKGVLFQAQLGTMYEKMNRVRALSEYLAEEIGGPTDLKEHASRAALLCKVDLVSEVVGEFPKLQGVMGRIYATVAKEPGDVAPAIEEHYRPTYSGGKLPETATGAILSMADKIDSICGCFSVGLVPTGASDPYALRRQGIGIIQIMHDKQFSVSLKALIDTSTQGFNEKSNRDLAAISDDVYNFLKNRIVYLLAEDGYSKDVIAAVTGVTVDSVPDVWKRAGALEQLKSQPDFEPLAIAFKRVVNIIKKSDISMVEGSLPDVSEALFQHESETALLASFKQVQQKASESIANGAYDQALVDIAALRSPVDEFFEGVLVNTDDEKVRSNRYALLGHVASLFDKFADFSKLTT